MTAIPHRAPQQRLAAILDLLCRAVAERGGRGFLAGPLVILIWVRLNRLAGRILRLVARIEAGEAPRTPRPRGPRPHRSRPPRPPLPRGKAWLVRLVPELAACAGSQLQYLLTEPDMQALAAADPRIGRLLRPLCHMLGLAPPPEIAKPPPAPRARPERPASLEAPPAAASQAAPPSPRRPAPLSASLPAPLPLPRQAACGPPPLPA